MRAGAQQRRKIVATVGNCVKEGSRDGMMLPTTEDIIRPEFLNDSNHRA